MKRYQQDSNAPAHLRALIDSARTDELAAERRRRVAARLGIGAALVPSTVQAPDGGASEPRSAPTVPGSRATLAKLALGALVVIGTASVVASFSRESRTTRASMPVATATAAAAATAAMTPAPVTSAESVPSVSIAALPDVARGPGDTPHAHAPSRPLARAAAPSAPLPAAAESAADPDDLHAELVALEAVRAATAAGNPSEALRRLDAYGATFHGGKLREEASVLRIEALAARGDRDAANTAAEQLLRESPHTVYAARVRAAVDRASREQSQ